MDRVARRGPLARAPGALKGGHFRNRQHFCRSWRGDPLEKNKFSKKSLTLPKNWKGDLWGFSTSILSQNKKIEGGKFLFSEKTLSVEKTEKGDPLGFSNIHFDAKQQKNWRGTLWGKNVRKKVSQCRKKLKGGTLWSRPVWYVTRENRKNLFGSVRLAKWCNLLQ